MWIISKTAVALAAFVLVVLEPTLARSQDVERPAGAPLQLEINRPQTPFDCDTPRGESWYGSTDRCLEELCAGENVYNEYIFQGSRARKNPCYGRSPTEFKSR
jgi:hypothetical protein